MKQLKTLFNRYLLKIIKKQDATKNIAIGFVKYYRDRGGNVKTVILDSFVYTEFRTDEDLFNEYLNTL